MQRIVVAAKAGAEQPWLADAAADLAQQTGAEVSVVSLDGLDVEALRRRAPSSRSREGHRGELRRAAARRRRPGRRGRAPGPGDPRRARLRGEKDADVIVCGASTKGTVARRVLGSVPVELIQRARRPVLEPASSGARR
jgi:nucleotide-binding universal stress UspA family protein